MVLEICRYSVVFLCISLLTSANSDGQLRETHLHRGDRAKWDRILKIPTDCQKRFSGTAADNDEYSGLVFDHMNENETLVIVDCYLGAYQPGVILYLMNEHPNRRAKLLKLNGIESDADLDGNPLLYQMFDGLVHFRRTTSTLEILQKYRGLGDCGQFLRYRYARGSFSLIEIREQECATAGIPGSTDYDHWPIKHSP
jgi:Protein of unknown function (DUF1176)